MANEGGFGALLSGMAGGYTAGKQMQRDMANVKADGKKPDALGLPAQQPQQMQPQQSATGATLPPVTQPATVAPAAETQPTGTWNTIAGYLNQQG